MRAATNWRFAHHRIVDGERCLIWGNGIGEVLVPVTSREYIEALNDRAWQHNDLVNVGEDDILNVYFRATTAPTTFYGRLYDITTPPPAETATLAATGGTEVSGTGYPGSVSWARNTTDFAAPADSSGRQTTTSTTKTWTAGSTWSVGVDHLILADAQTGTSGKLICWAPLSATRSLVNTDTLDVSVAIGLT